MGILKAIITGIKKNINKSKEVEKQPSTKFAEKDYNLGLDICQKTLFVLILVGCVTLPIDFAITLIICVSIGGFCILLPVFSKIFKKKSKALLEKNDAKRFLSMPSKVWNWIVGVPLGAFLIFDFIRNFDFINIAIYPIIFICVYAILTKNVSLKYNYNPNAHDPNKRGTKEWVEANGLERVHVAGGDIIYRDKYGKYYDNNTGSYLPIPEPITIRNKK